MLLKNLMEEKQLDFNQPLLSVRRFSSTAATSKAESKRKPDNSLPKLPPLPTYKSELKSGPIRNPGTVPFTWEKTPGRPKDETKSRSKAIERAPVAPKLPPGRKQKCLEKASEDKNSKWFQKGNVISSSQSVSSTERNEDAESFKSQDDDDEAYVDAVDTLSRSESFFFNCSISGVSGLDNADWKPTPDDSQSRDFMMGRFLPAAKAMASETPHYTMRRKTIAQEQQSRYASRVVSTDKKRPLKPYSPNRLPFRIPDERSEETDEDDYEELENSSAPICGLLPRFCLKSSFGLLNPVPSMRMHAHEAISSARRPHARFSSASSSSGTESGSARGDVYEQRSTIGSHQANKLELQSVSNQNAKTFGRRNFRDLLADENANRESGSVSPVEKTLYIDSVQDVKSPRYFNASDRGDDFESHLKSSEMVETLWTDSPFGETKHLNTVDKSNSLDSIDSSLPCCPEKSADNKKTDVKISSGEDDQDLIESTKMTRAQGSPQTCIKDSVSSTKSTKGVDVVLESKEGNLLQLALPLPLPKSPSESWLKRTLPSVSTRNSSSWSSLGMRNCSSTQAPGSPSSDPKWETIVKTSNGQHGHSRFSQETLTPISEN